LDFHAIIQTDDDESESTIASIEDTDSTETIVITGSSTTLGNEDSISEEGFSWTINTESLTEGFSSLFPRGNGYNGVFWKDVKE